MAEAVYNEEYYKKFYNELIPLLQGKNITTVDLRWLEKEARKFANKTQYGSYVWMSKFSSRLAPKTIFLGSEKVRLPKPTQDQLKLVENAPLELDKVLHLLKSLPFIHIRRQMGDNDYFNPTCNLYVCTADPKNARLAYMWASTMFDASSAPARSLI